MFQTTNQIILLQYMLLSGTSVFTCPDHQNPSDNDKRPCAKSPAVIPATRRACLKRSEGKETKLGSSGIIYPSAAGI